MVRNIPINDAMLIIVASIDPMMVPASNSEYTAIRNKSLYNRDSTNDPAIILTSLLLSIKNPR